MGNVADKICRENENTHFIFNSLPTTTTTKKIMPFMRYVGKCGRAR